MAPGYPALLLSSNLALFGCDSETSRSAAHFEEPRVLDVPAASTRAEAREAVRAARRSRSEARCHEGLISGPSLDIDVHRLGVLCGPANGLEPLGPPFELQVTVPEAIATPRLSGASCLMAFVATSSDEPLELEWRSPERVFARCTIDRLGACPAVEPHCLDARTDAVELAVVAPLPVQVSGRVWRREP